MEILTMIGVQKCQFLAKSENWTNTYAYCSSKLIVNNECLACKHSFDFLLINHITNIVWFNIDFIKLITQRCPRPILPLVVLPLCKSFYDILRENLCLNISEPNFFQNELDQLIMYRYFNVMILFKLHIHFDTIKGFYLWNKYKILNTRNALKIYPIIFSLNEKEFRKYIVVVIICIIRVIIRIISNIARKILWIISN